MADNMSTNTQAPFIPANTVAGMNLTKSMGAGAIANGELGVEQASQWNALNEKGGAVQFEGKAIAYKYQIMNKALDNAMKSLG